MRGAQSAELGVQGFWVRAQGSEHRARAVLLCACPSEVHAQGVGALRARLRARRLSRNVLHAKLGGLRANLFGARTRLVNFAGKGKRLAGEANRLAGAQMRLAARGVWGSGQAMRLERQWFGRVPGLTMGAAAANRFAPDRKCRVSAASPPALQPIDLGIAARVGCGASKNMTRGRGMLGNRWGRLDSVGMEAIPCFSGLRPPCLNRSEGMHVQRKTYADQALAEVATDDRSDSGPMVQG